MENFGESAGEDEPAVGGSVGHETVVQDLVEDRQIGQERRRRAERYRGQRPRVAMPQQRAEPGEPDRPGFRLARVRF